MVLVPRSARLRSAAAFFLFIIAAGCGGGGGGGTSVPPPTATPTATPSAAPTLPPSSSGTLAVSAQAATSASFGPVTGGYSGVVTVPAANVAASLNAVFTAIAPSGAPTVQHVRRRPQNISASGIQPLAFFTVTSNVTVTFPTAPTFTLTLPNGSTTSGSTFAYVAEFDPTNGAAGWTTIEGPAAVLNATTLGFAGAPPPLTLVANKTYVFMVFIVPQAIPTPSPTSTPVPVSVASPIVYPAAVKITSLASPVAVSVTETGYTGSIALNVAPCTGIASVVLAPQPQVYMVTGIAPGTCSATFTDTFAQSVALPISVTVSQLVVK
jgi:hypothetical protein